MKKTLASILAGISLAFGNISKANDLPMEIELQDRKYYASEQINLEVTDMNMRKVIDRSQNQQVYMKGEYTPEGKVTLSYSTHPFEEKAERPTQGFASNSRIYIGLPEGTTITDVSQSAEFLGNFDKIIQTELKPLEETRYAKTFLKMGNNGIEKLRAYDPLQTASDSLNDSIFLLTGTDLNLGDKLSIYAGLKAFSDHLTKQEQERGKSTFKGELEMKEIALFPFDSLMVPTETKREIHFQISPGTFSGETIPFTVYQKIVLGREKTQGTGKLETFFTGEIENPSATIKTENQASIIEAGSLLKGFWKYTDSPGWIKNYISITPLDKKTLELKFLETNINEGRITEEKSLFISYDEEKKTLKIKVKKDSKEDENSFYGVRRLSDKEKNEESKKIREAVSFWQTLGLPWALYSASDQELLNSEAPYNQPGKIPQKKKWYDYRKEHPDSVFDEDSKIK